MKNITAIMFLLFFTGHAQNYLIEWEQDDNMLKTIINFNKEKTGGLIRTSVLPNGKSLRSLIKLAHNFESQQLDGDGARVLNIMGTGETTVLNGIGSRETDNFKIELDRNTLKPVKAFITQGSSKNNLQEAISIRLINDAELTTTFLSYFSNTYDSGFFHGIGKSSEVKELKENYNLVTMIPGSGYGEMEAIVEERTKNDPEVLIYAAMLPDDTVDKYKNLGYQIVNVYEQPKTYTFIVNMRKTNTDKTIQKVLIDDDISGEKLEPLYDAGYKIAINEMFNNQEVLVMNATSSDPFTYQEILEAKEFPMEEVNKFLKEKKYVLKVATYDRTFKEWFIVMDQSIYKGAHTVFDIKYSSMKEWTKKNPGFDIIKGITGNGNTYILTVKNILTPDSNEQIIGKLSDFIKN